MFTSSLIILSFYNLFIELLLKFLDFTVIVQEESGEGDGDWGALQGQEVRDRELQGNGESIGKDGHTAGNQG